jgi:hypothetical protein
MITTTWLVLANHPNNYSRKSSVVSKHYSRKKNHGLCCKCHQQSKKKYIEGSRFTSQLILDWARHHQPPMDTKTTEQKRRFLVCVNLSFFCVSMVHQGRRAEQFEWKHGERNAQKNQLQYMSNWWRTWIGASLQPYSVFVFAICTRISWEFTILISLFRRKTMESSSAKCT